MYCIDILIALPLHAGVPGTLSKWYNYLLNTWSLNMKILLAMQEGYLWLGSLIKDVCSLMNNILLCFHCVLQYMKKECDFSKPATLQNIIKTLKVMDSEIEKKKEFK